MELIFGLLFIILFILFIIGMVKPKMILPWDKNPNRWKVLGYSIAFFIVITIVATLTIPVKEINFAKSKIEISDKEKPFTYEIISEEEHVDLENGFNKSRLEIRLDKKIDKKQLEKIAETFRETRNSYDNLWIFYYLPEMKVGSGAWATTHFTPDLEIKILGATAEQTKKIVDKSNEIEGKIIGKWKEEQYTSSVYVLYQNNGQLIMRTISPNSQTSDEKLFKKKDGSSIRYDYTEGYNGEYFKVNSNNELEFYNKEDKMFTKGIPIK